MGRRRPFSPDSGPPAETDPSTDAESTLPPSVGVELMGYGPGGVDLDSVDSDVAAAPNRAAQRGALVAVAGLLGLAFLALFLLSSSSAATERADDAAGSSGRAVPTTIDRPSITSAPRSAEELAELEAAAQSAENLRILEDLGQLDGDLLDGLVIAWITDEDRLSIRELDTGAALEVSTLAQHDLPPLPKHIQLIGAENATWLIDLVDPEYSGKLSNTVRMVRLGADLDSYAFVSESDDGGPTDFFVGSLWGPAMNGTAQTPSSWSILPVPGAGIVVSNPQSESSSIRGSGLEPLPRQVGRVVAATVDHLAGISCDNRLNCVGAVSRWDGSEQEVFDGNALSNAATVRISPDGGHLLSVIGSRWTIFDLEGDRSEEFIVPLPVDSSLSWTPDSNGVVWMVEGTVVAIDVGAGFSSGVANEFEPSVVSPIGVVGERLPNSDVMVYDVAAIASTAAVNR